MRHLILLMCVVNSFDLNAQSFSNTQTNWNCPNGGNIASGVTNGYNFLAGNALQTDNTGSQTWSIIDMNGDNKPDLVVAAQLQGGNVTSFSPSSNQYWKVYFNTGNSFSASASNWYCPNGGAIINGTTLGFNGIAGVALNSHSSGSQSWSLLDMNNDQKPDLVVTAQLQGGNVTSFSPTSNQYWKVYLNTGNSFSTSATNWYLPNGGNISGGVSKGFNGIGGTAITSDNAGSQTWSTMDLNGDFFIDLVVTGQHQGGNVTSFSPSSNQYWKLYAGNGNGFSTISSNWNCPNGGTINGGITYGYNASGGYALNSHNTGSQSWSVMDMNFDYKPDLIVSGQLQGGNVTSFSPASNQYWKIYFNNGSTFSNSATNWNCPSGGNISGGVSKGFNFIGGTALSNDNTGSQSWSVMDLDGDNFVDLVVTAQLQGGNVTSFSPTSNQYWKMYAGNGSGFSTSAINWNCPNGGLISNGTTFGFNAAAGIALTSHNTGSQSWSISDLDGNGKIDLAVCAQLQGGNVTSFSPSSNQYWKVYLNTSTVGVLENETATKGIVVYPNPSKEYIIVKSNETDDLIKGFSIYNNNGKVIDRKNNLLQREILVHTESLNPGVYFISVYTNNGLLSKKFINE